MVSEWEIHSSMQLAITVSDTTLLWLLYKKSDASTPLLANTRRWQVPVCQVRCRLGQFTQRKGIFRHSIILFLLGLKANLFCHASHLCIWSSIICLISWRGWHNLCLWSLYLKQWSFFTTQSQHIYFRKSILLSYLEKVFEWSRLNSSLTKKLHVWT